jgi:T5orf172 domain
MAAKPDHELTNQDILRRSASEQDRYNLLKGRGFVEAAMLRAKEVKDLNEIARTVSVSERIERLSLIYRQRSRDKKRDPLFASSYAVLGWKGRRTTQENRLRRAKSIGEKSDAEAQIRKYDLVIARAEGLLSFNPMLGDENSLEAELVSQPTGDGIIYLAYCQNWSPYLKIGCSTNWLHRQCMLQTGTPENVRLWAFAKSPAATDLILYEYQFHLKLADTRHPLGREFFKTDVTSFEAVGRELKSPTVRSGQAGTKDPERDVSLAEDLKSVDYDGDMLRAALL